MDSRVPAPPSKPLHNFDLPITLRWSKLQDGNAPAPGGVNRQLPLRHVRSPPRRPKTVFPASLLETLSGGSVSSPPPPLPLPPPPPPRRQSSSGEISSRQSPFPGGGFQTKQTPIRGDSSSSSSSKPSLQAQERKKPSAVMFGGGEPDQQMLSWFRGQAARSFPSRDWPPLEPSKKTDQSALIKHSRNNYPFDTIKNGAYSSSTSAGKAAAAAEKVDEKKKSKGKQVDGDPGRIIKKSKIVIKIPCKNNNNNSSSKAPPPPDQKKQNQNPPPAKIVTGDQVQEDKGKNVVVDDETKIWNLRPRKTTPFKKSSSTTRSGKNATVAAGSGADKGGGGGNKLSGSMPEKNKPGGDDNQSPTPPLMKSAPPKNEGGGGAAAEKKADGGGEVKKKEIHKKPTLTIALTKREIEEDIYALTGAKPARRPRKRPKNVQKQLDMVFPGLWLVNNYS